MAYLVDLRNGLAACCCLLAVLLAFSLKAQAQTQKPNIIFIMADDLGYETLSCNGGESYQTPNLDRMAQQGMRFTNAHATPLCTPSRIQLMTGKYNFRNYKGFGILDPAETTFAHLLREAGYVTGITGKWQLFGDAGQQKLAGQQGTVPDKAGFDEYFVWQIEAKALRYKDPDINSGQGLKSYPGQYGPDLFADFGKDFIRRHRDKPFFLYYPMVLPHDPFQPTPDDHDFANFDTKAKVNDPAYFGSMVRYLDKKVGEILRQVEEAGISRNTLIIFAGDNGTSTMITSRMNGQQIKGGKGFPKTNGTHVPFIAQWEGVIQKGQVNQNLVDFTDLLPTFLQVAGQPIPAGFQTDGVSLYDQLKGIPQAKAREWVYCSYDPRWGGFKPYTWIHDERWKLYQTGEFYNLQKDPSEKQPLTDKDLSLEGLAAKKKFQGELARMQPAVGKAHPK